MAVLMGLDTITRLRFKPYQRIKIYADEDSKFKYASDQKSYYESLCVQNNYENTCHACSEELNLVAPEQLVDYYTVQSRYLSVIHSIRSKKGAIRVAFLVVFDTVFPYWKVFDSMLKDHVFDPFIVVVPNISRSFDY